MKNLALIAIAMALFTLGCASHKSAKATLQRGWIGGEYQQSGRGSLPAGQRSAVFVKQVYSGTPAEQAGLQPADLILELDGQPVKHLRDFRQFVDAASPGSRVAIRVLRAGQTIELPLTMGRETFQQWHALSMGLRLSSRIDLWPDKDFTLLPLLQYKIPTDRAELRSPKEIVAKQSNRTPASGESGTRSDEGWSVWFVLFGLDAHKRILSQESVSMGTAQTLGR